MCVAAVSLFYSVLHLCLIILTSYFSLQFTFFHIIIIRKKSPSLPEVWIMCVSTVDVLNVTYSKYSASVLCICDMGAKLDQSNLLIQILVLGCVYTACMLCV